MTLAEQFINIKKYGYVLDNKHYEEVEVELSNGTTYKRNQLVGSDKDDSKGKEKKPESKNEDLRKLGNKKIKIKKDSKQTKFEQTHKQTTKGTRSAKNNTPMRKPKLTVKKDIPVTKDGKTGSPKVGTLLKGQEIENRTSLVRAEGIDCLDRLKKTYGKSDPELWSKDEGNGIVLIKGKPYNLTLHFYSYNEEDIFEPKQHYPKKRR